MSLDSRMVVRRGGFVLDAELAADDHEVVALLGPNGSGKSTLLGAIAGLLPVESGTISANGRLLTSARAGRRMTVPVPRRRVGLLGQDALLFPHLTALQNVLFGARAAVEDPTRAGAAARDWLEAVGLSGFEDRRPAALSGGQQQRAAIARALAAEPDILLLDEPMASLDVESASLIRTLLRERLSSSGTTTILVTHDVVDAIVLADRVVILEDGRITDDGDASVVLGRPIDRFAAALAGLNLLRGSAMADGSVATEDGHTIRGHGDALAEGSDAWAAFPRSAVSVREPAMAPSDDAANSWTGEVSVLEPAAGGIRVVLDGGGVVAEVPSTEVFEHGLRPGAQVRLQIDPAFVTVYAHRPGPGGASD